jgi:hypothetical protein
VFNIVAANDDELAPGIYRSGIEHSKPWLARASGAAPALLGDTPYHPGDHANQHQHDHEGQ